MTIWVGSPERICTGDEAVQAILRQNDACYYNPAVGVVQVDMARWRQAQEYEKRGWLQCWNGDTNDRCDEHARNFMNYVALKKDLGRVMEVGCGPFTQLQRIIDGRTATHITLIDPLLKHYLQLRYCPYKTGKFKNLPTLLRTKMAEQITDIELYDTVICINVLEHVLNARKVLEVLWMALKRGGTLVLGERTYDEFDPMKLYDVGHPIHIRRTVLDNFRRRFSTTLYSNNDYTISQK
jgi:SAM-dependent methyltransferase